MIILSMALTAGLIVCGCMYGTYRMGLKEGREEGRRAVEKADKLEKTLVRLIRSVYTYSSSPVSTMLVVNDIRKEFPQIDEEVGKDFKRTKEE